MKKERGNVLLRRLDYWGGIPLIPLGALWRKVEKIFPKQAHGQKIGILALGAIGDLLLASALINGIRQCSPSCQLELVTSQANAGAIPLIPHINAWFYLPITNIPGHISHLRRRSYDILIDMGQWARINALLCDLSGAGMTVGFDTPGQLRSLGYDRAVPHRRIHEIENFCALGRSVWPEFTGKPRLALPPWEMRSRVICCHMWPAEGKGRHLKEWPPAYWAQLITELVKREWTIRLTGSRQDKIRTLSFKQKYFPANPAVQPLTDLPLAQLGNYFTQVGAVISVNSGPMHLAALANVPTIGLHGATNPERWGPRGDKTVALMPEAGSFGYLHLGYEYPPRIESAMPALRVESVMEALEKLKVL